MSVSFTDGGGGARAPSNSEISTAPKPADPVLTGPETLSSPQFAGGDVKHGAAGSPPPLPSELKPEEGSSPSIVGGVVSAQPSPAPEGDSDDDGGDYGSYDEPELGEKLKALRRIKPSPHASVLNPRKPPAVREYVLSDYTSCIFPTSFFQIIEAGRIFQRATIPYRFIQLLENETLNELTDDFFLIFCARNGKEVAGDPSFYETRDPQDLIESIFNQYDAENALLLVASGLNAAIRTYVNWHKHCMMITADYFEHRQQVTKKILLNYHYALDEYDPKQEAQNTIFANRFYSYALSLALARGYAKAYPSSKKTALRGEAKRVDAGKAWTIYTEVETLFLKYVNNDKREDDVDAWETFGHDPLENTGVSTSHLGTDNVSGTSFRNDVVVPVPFALPTSSELPDATVNAFSSPASQDALVDASSSPASPSAQRTTADKSPKQSPRKGFLVRYKDIIAVLDNAPLNTPRGLPARTSGWAKLCKNSLKTVLITTKLKEEFAQYINIKLKRVNQRTTDEDKKLAMMEDQFREIPQRCTRAIVDLLKPKWRDPNILRTPLGRSNVSPSGFRREGFADVDPDEESTDDDVDAAMAEHMLDGP